MKDEPYAGMGNVSKSEGLYLKNEKKSQSRTAFYLVDQWAGEPIALLDDTDARANDKLIYLTISSFADRGSGSAFPTQERLVKRASRCKRVIGETITHLVKIGWATKIRRGQGRANIVILHSHKCQKFTKSQLEHIKEIVKGKIADFRKANR
ncbi:MAG: hypothetical protein E3J56_15885 [Candidatus Aminicenantes bacterium]|nr:MAG: hypothetical protein E3J56_15885 [Candidatus Aminicenantes bacterium]